MKHVFQYDTDLDLSALSLREKETTLQYTIRLSTYKRSKNFAVI